METVSTNRAVRRVRHEIKQRNVEVARVDSVGASFISVTFKGDALEDFISESFDDHVKFIIPGTDGEPVRRDYTPRHFDNEARELTIEFVRHGEGVASEWARHAQVGQHAVIAGPRGSMIIPENYEWHLLVGDASALPAIRRRLEELPDTTQAIVIVQVDDASDRQAFKSDARLTVQWVATSEELVAAVRALAPSGKDGFAWCAGEASVMVQLRQILAVEKNHPKEAMRVAAYWKRGAQDYHERLD